MLGAAAIGIAWWKAYRRPPAGAPAALAVIAASVTRLVVEPLQPSISGGPVLFYGAGLVIGVAALVWSVARR
jgi:hypothetical protein